MTTSTYPLETMLSVLGNSHARLAAIVEPLTATELAGPSYDDDWSIAQVLSHLGSGAEIFGLLLDAGLRGEDAPVLEQYQEIWARWNAKSPQDQARDGLAADAAFLDRLAALDPAQRTGWRLTFFGDERGLADMAQMRVGEHAMHTWDVAVMRDSKATVAGDAVRADPGHRGRPRPPARQAGRRAPAGERDHVRTGTAFPARHQPGGRRRLPRFPR